MKIDYNKHIWEGWTVKDFIEELKPQFNTRLSNAEEFGNKPFVDKNDLKQWCIDNQPYYKKYIPEVVNHFNKELNLK